VAINDVLPLKAAGHDAITNLKCFGASGQKRLNFDFFICIRFALPLYAADSDIVIISSVYKGWVKPPVIFFALVRGGRFLIPKTRSPMYHVSFRRHSPLSLEEVENDQKYTAFGANYFHQG